MIFFSENNNCIKYVTTYSCAIHIRCQYT